LQKIVHFSCLSWLAASSLRPLWVPVAFAAADEAGTAAHSQEHGGTPAVLWPLWCHCIMYLPRWPSSCFAGGRRNCPIFCWVLTKIRWSAVPPRGHPLLWGAETVQKARCLAGLFRCRSRVTGGSTAPGKARLSAYGLAPPWSLCFLPLHGDDPGSLVDLGRGAGAFR
jgi:hypothetical protein